MAAQRHADALAALAEQTGRQVDVHPEAHQASLEQAARESLSAAATITRAPSILREQRQVKVTVDELPAPEKLSSLRDRFREQTGFSLEVSQGKASTPAPRQTYDDTGRMEINAAFAEIDRAFAARPHRPHKKSKKSDADGPYIELSFISPEVGARFEELLGDLQYRTSWRIVVANKVDQQAVLATAREVIPDTWQQKKGPGLDVTGRRLLLRLVQEPPAEQRQEVSEALEERTGFTLG